MSKTPVQLKQIDSALAKQLGSFVDLPKTTVPFTIVTNRAQCTDFSNDLLPRMGVERIMVQRIVEVPDEFGPAGEAVYKPQNDLHDQIRIIGPWINNLSNDGPEFQNGAASGAYVEVTFYGTGLNIIGMADSARNYDVYVDGVFASSRTTGGNSSVIRQRNYSQNQIFNAASGLSLGLHTIRLTNLTNARWWGFEIVNEATTIKTSSGNAYAGSKQYSLQSLDSQAYNSSFASGSLGTRGGHVVVYLDTDGTVKKAVTPTDTTQLNLGAANHTNEEVIRRYNWREFGAGRTDDFSSLDSSASTRSFTLDDGTTCLTGSNVNASSERLGWTGTGFITFTFVGTGLDFFGDFGSSGVFGTVTIDGTAVGSYQRGVTSDGVVKIVSGLPYGTHTVKVEYTSSADICRGFMVYGPKKPSIPSDAVELADYFVMANYTANTTQGDLFLGRGLLRKGPVRELIYNGTWSASSYPDPNSSNGGYTNTSTNGSSVRYTFFGTGFDLRFYSAAGAGVNIFQVSVDGSTNLSGFTTSFYGAGGNSLAFTASTGQMTGNSAADDSGLSVSGLSLGIHTVIVTYNNAAAAVFRVNSFDLITPIHSPKSNLPDVLQNMLSVGSNGIGDSRVLPGTSDLDIPNWGQITGITTSASTTSVTPVPLPDMVLNIKTTGKPVEIEWEVFLSNNTTNIGTAVTLWVDGLQIGYTHAINVSAGGAGNEITGGVILALEAGVHNIQLMWNVSSQTASLENNRRLLRAKEL